MMSFCGMSVAVIGSSWDYWGGCLDCRSQSRKLRHVLAVLVTKLTSMTRLFSPANSETCRRIQGAYLAVQVRSK